MRKIKNNQHYFKVSQKNPEKMLDNFYIFDERHPRLDTYIARTKEIKNILITIKTLLLQQERKHIVEKYFLELARILKEFSNCSEFACFVNACDSFLDFTRKDPVLLGKIVDRYFEKRILSESAPEEWIQAILDSNSARKKGKCGEKKLLHILKEKDFEEVKNWDDFFAKKKCMALFSKAFNIKNVRKNLGIRLSTKKQNKNLDVIIKAGAEIFLCEAKHLNTSGGAQDKQVAELIEIVSLKEKNQHISYISFIDGTYANVLLHDARAGGKLKTQQDEIKEYLLRNQHNFWVNTAGFTALFSDINEHFSEV